MFSQKMVLCGVCVLALFVGLSITGGVPSVLAKECYRPGDCKTECINDPVHSKSECREVYKRAIRDDLCGIGNKNDLPCGHLFIGSGLCTEASGSCGGDSYSNGYCG